MIRTATFENDNRVQFCNGFLVRTPRVATALSFRFVFTGSERYAIGKRNLAVHPECFLLIRKGTCYSSNVASEQAVNMLAIDFDDDFVNDFANTRSCTDAKLLEDHSIQPLLQTEYMERLYPFKGDIRYTAGHLAAHARSGCLDNLLMTEYLHHCLLNYHNVFRAEICDAGKNLQSLNPATRQEILRRLNLARDFIYSNYEQPLSLADISGAACMSCNHLLRTFRQVFNLSPHQFLIRLRLQRARHLLKCSTYPVSEIVGIVGFENTSSFIRLFRENFRTTPLKYRQSA
jgi:AraC family transcriptional regulator